MTIAVRGSCPTTGLAGSGSTKQSAAFSPDPISGSTILVAFVIDANAVTSVTDTAGNTYTLDKTASNAANTVEKIFLYRSSNITGGSNFKVTVTLTGNADFSFAGIEVTGLTNSSPADGSGSSQSSAGTTPSPSAFSTTNANDILIIVTADLAGAAHTYTEPSSPGTFTSFVRDTGLSPGNIPVDAAYLIVSSTQSSINPTYTVSPSANWVAMAFAYKGGSSNTPPWWAYASQSVVQ